MTPTSSFPFHSQGLIDFSVLNFTRTVQTEYYNASGTLTGLNIEQSYDPAVAMVLILGLMLLVISATAFWIWLIAKRS